MDTEKRKGKGKGNQGRREGQEPHVKWMESFRVGAAGQRRSAAGGRAGDLAAFFLLFCRFCPMGHFLLSVDYTAHFLGTHTQRHTTHYICRCVVDDRHGLCLAYAWLVWETSGGFGACVGRWWHADKKYWKAKRHQLSTDQGHLTVDGGTKIGTGRL